MSVYKDLSKVLIQETNQDKGITIILSEKEEVYIPYKDVYEHCIYICNRLQQLGAQKGDEVVIQCKQLQYFIDAFWACLLGGFIAVPLDINNNEYRSEVNEKVFSRLNRPFLLCENSNNINSKEFSKRFINLSEVNYKEALSNERFMPEDNNDRSDVAYVQFSSGSTGQPRGVAIKRENIMANVYDIIERLELKEDDKIMSWQSLTHCYGLIVFHIVPVVLGINQYLIPTDVYMHSPLIWLNKASQYRITRLGSIPFALKHFINFYVNSRGPYSWDLSCVKSLTVGGEQVMSELCYKFADLMKPYKLAKKAIKPAYGLAEATTIVSICALEDMMTIHKIAREEIVIGKEVVFRNKLEDEGISFVEIGKPIGQMQIRILDDNNQVLPEKTIGYLYIKGDNVTSYYYNDSDATKQVFLEDGWLNTGDVAFVVKGRLVIVGREKELIVVNGKKYTCVDIENIINEKVTMNDFGPIVVCNGLDPEKKLEQAIMFVENTKVLNDIKTMKAFMTLTSRIKEVVFETAGLTIEYIIPIEKIPKTYSGKIKRKELTNDFNMGKFNAILNQCVSAQKIMENTNLEVTDVLNKNKIRTIIVETIEEMFHIKITDFNLPFNSYGIVSVNIPPFITRINNIFNINIKVSSLFNSPNINVFSEYIYQVQNSFKGKDGEGVVNDNQTVEEDKIAIIGMSCRFPGGADSVEEYWKVLVNGVDGICDVPETRWSLEKYYDQDENVPGKMYCKKGGFLDISVDEFDARFFNISPKEAMALDPQQRLLLELTWEAFENADLDITKYSGTPVGVYLGMSTTEYTVSNLYSGDLSRIDAYSLTGTCMSTACGRVAYTFGFEGPCIAVDTACSSALTALHLACTAIKSGEMDMSVVGGINLMLSPAPNIGFSKLHATSPDGHSKAFDASANGYGRGEGCGIIILKRLSDAVRDKDNILGVICASGINQDGKSNGLTAPNGASQAKLIKNTLTRANISPLDVDYIEMHGTGTKLGDPIEVGAIVDTYGKGRSLDNPLKIGSVKSNVGHLEAAAGIASIIKVLLSMKHNLIPANLHFDTPNPFINWKDSPVKVIDEHTPWEKNTGIKRAGVNGFGFGGSNAHIILEEYKGEKEEISSLDQGLNYILKLSTKSEKSLPKQISNYIELIKKSDKNTFEDIVYSANRGRADFDYRFVVTGNTREQVLARLEAYISGDEPEGVFTSLDEKNVFEKERKVAFMFTGQGSQYINMGKLLYNTNDVFKDTMDQCARLFKPLILKSITDLLYGENTNADLIAKTVYAQPLIFSIEYALYEVWKSYGVKPEVVMGHSIGEYAAAVVAGIMSLEDAAKLVSIRGRLMDSAPGSGAMGTIFATEDVVSEMIKAHSDKVSIAAHNAKESCVISGDSEAVEEILEKAEEKGIRVKKLKVSHGFHSQLMAPILEDFNAMAQEIKYQKANVRFVSALYAKEINEQQILDSNYWTKHIREKVDFYNAVKSVADSESYVLLEVGSNRVLAALCKLIYDDQKVIVGTLNIKKEDAEQLTQSIAKLYVAGIDINWANVECKGKKTWHKVQIPNYPFERVKYWSDLLYDRQSGNICNEECHKFLGQKIESPFINNSVIFQSRFTGESPYFMREHVIFNIPISPAAAHVSMMLSAVKETENPLSCTLREIEFRAPLAVNVEEERQVQVCLDRTLPEKMKFSIVSKDVDSTKWLIHSQGQVTASGEYYKNDNSINISEVEAMEANTDPEEGLYAAMHKAGFDLGEGFRRMKKVVVEGDQSICLISPLKTIPNLDMYELYPGVIDSIIQTGLNPVLNELYGMCNDETSDDIKTTIPYYMEELNYNYRKSNNLWCRTTTKVVDDIVYVQIDVYNEKGEDIMKIKNLMVKLTNQESLLREMKNNYANFYYHTDWIKEQLNTTDAKTGEYIIVADDRVTGENICKQLINKGNEAVLVLEGSIFTKENEALYYVNSSKKEEWHNLVKAAVEQSSHTEIKFVYFNTLKHSNDEVNMDSLKGLLYLTQAINKANLKSKVKIVTREVQNINRISSINLSQAPLWGYAKVVALEYPELFEGIIDITETNLSGGMEQLVSEIMNSDKDEVCLDHNNERYVSRLIKHSEYIKKGYPRAKKIEIKEDGTYLITGGTGAVGMVYANYLVSKGAKTLALMCRHEPKEDVASKIEVLKEKGVNVELVYADVCNKESVKQALAGFTNICGVVHAAGVLKDKMLSEQSWEDFEQVLAPKVFGTLNVYDALNKEHLDFFMMLSSITSVVGNMGQSNYAAANYFMNRFAVQMANDKLPGFTFCWGPWQEGGMALANETTSKNISNFGITTFSSEVGTRIIDEFFEQPYVNMMIADIDWKVYSNSIEGNKKLLEKVLEDISDSKQSDNSKVEGSLIDELKNLSNEERKELIINRLQVVCGKIMGFDKGEILAVDASFKEQGADSLMMFSMRSAINKLLNTDINVSVFFNYPSLVKLTDYLVDEVLFENEEATESNLEESTEDLLSELANLTD